MKKDTESIDKYAHFKNELKSAIEFGIDEDWVYNGEDEVRVSTFYSEDSLNEVIKLLEKYGVDKQFINGLNR